VTNDSKPKGEVTLKAGALMCPVCCVELLKVEVDFDVNGVVLRDVKVLRCPVCQDEQFSPEQLDAVEVRLRHKKKQ
jgi:hypothetical protein